MWGPDVLAQVSSAQAVLQAFGLPLAVGSMVSIGRDEHQASYTCKLGTMPHTVVEHLQLCVYKCTAKPNLLGFLLCRQMISSMVQTQGPSFGYLFDPFTMEVGRARPCSLWL